MIDSLIADIGALPTLTTADSLSITSDGPSLSTVVLAAASHEPLPLLTAPGSDTTTSIHEARQLLPKENTGLRLAQHYIEQIYPRLPFFSVQGFWAQFQYVYSNEAMSVPISQDLSTPDDPAVISSSDRQDPSSTLFNQGYSFFTVLLVLAISTASLSRSTDSVISDQAQRLFQAALLLRESAILPNTIVGVQSLLFLIQFATLNPSVLDAWYLIGVGMRNCIDLGLHQDPQPITSISASLLETRRRLWWSMYSFDRSMSLGCGRPVEVSDDVIGAALPSFQIESTASDVEIEGYLQRYRVLHLQSLIYDRLSEPLTPGDDAGAQINPLMDKLSAWRQGNSLMHSQNLVESEWHMGRMLLFRPCRLVPERTSDELSELWTSALAFASIYRQLVESNGIFYVQIASEKVYWTGLAMLYSYWQLRNSRTDIRPVDLWLATKDVTYILRALGERWEDGKILGGRFEEISARAIEILESDSDSHIAANLPPEVVSFSQYASLTSIWAAIGRVKGRTVGLHNVDDSLQDLISEIIRG